MTPRDALLGPLPTGLRDALAAALAARGATVHADVPERLDLVVAGRVGRREGPLDAAQHAPGGGVLADELVPLLALVRDVATPLAAAGGTLVLVASPLALRARAGRAADSMVDAGIAMLGSLVAVELAPRGVRCVVAAPGDALADPAAAILALADAPVSGAVVPLGDVSTAALFADA